MNSQFGQGRVIVQPITSTGAAGSPIELAVLQDVSLEFSVTTKKLYGAYRYAVAIADGEGEIKMTAKSAAFSANAFNTVLAAASTSGGRTWVNNEQGTVAAAAYTVAGAANFVPGTSVVWLTPASGGNARQLAVVAAAPVAGVSYVEGSTGTLTFAAGDNGATILVTYADSLTSGGQTLTLSNALQNTSLGARVTLYNQSINRSNNLPSTVAIQLNQVILPSLKFDFKSGDWTIPEYTMEVSADQNNNIGVMYFKNYDNN
jgi:hypothetical protein